MARCTNFLDSKIVAHSIKTPCFHNTNKQTVDGFTKQMDLVVKTGKVRTGSKRARMELIQGHSKMIILANSMHPVQKSEMEYLSLIGKIPVHIFSGDCIELGKVLKKNHRVNCVSVSNVGLGDQQVLFSSCVQSTS